MSELLTQLAHEKLDVYRCSIEFFSLAIRLAQAIPRGESEMRDQLRRAAMSIPLNIAEGSGKVTTADRQRFYAIARGSTSECSAILDVGALSGWFVPEATQQGKILLVRLVSMLTKMLR